MKVNELMLSGVNSKRATLIPRGDADMEIQIKLSFFICIVAFRLFDFFFVLREISIFFEYKDWKFNSFSTIFLNNLPSEMFSSSLCFGNFFVE